MIIDLHWPLNGSQCRADSRLCHQFFFDFLTQKSVHTFELLISADKWRHPVRLLVEWLTDIQSLSKTYSRRLVAMALLLNSRLRRHTERSRAHEIVVARTAIPVLHTWELGKRFKFRVRLGDGKVSANLLSCENILRHFSFHERCGKIRKHNLRVQSSFDNPELFLLNSPSFARFIYFLQ